MCQNITLVLSATLEIARDRVLKNIFLSHGHKAQLSLRLLQPRSTSHIEWECQAVGGVPPEGQRAHLEARYLYSCCVCFSARLEQEIPDHLPQRGIHRFPAKVPKSVIPTQTHSSCCRNLPFLTLYCRTGILYSDMKLHKRKRGVNAKERV